MLKFFAGVLISLSLATAYGQNGSISGTVTDAKSGETIIGANVVIQGTSIGAPTDLDGRFTITGVTPGEHTIQVSFITYKTQLIPNVVVVANKATALNVALEEESMQLEEVVVKAQADRSSEAALLMDRKKSVLFVQNIGAQELSRKGVSNAEAAVVQITGVTKQEGAKNVFVRGLGDRYNSTSLNGLPLPSEDPEYKNITLDFFNSDIIKSIDVNKTFTSDNFGDVTGANINILSKDLFDESEFRVDASFGANSQTLGRDFYRADGTNWLGTTNRSVPVSDLNTYSFDNSFAPNQVNGPLVNSSFALSGGKNFSIGANTLKTFLVASLNNDYFFKDGVVRQVNPVGGIRQDYDLQKWEYNASQIALANFSYEFARSNRISYNVLYVHDNKQSVGDYTGFSLNGNDDINDPNAYKTFIRRQQQNSNTILVNQLLSEIQLGDRLTLDLSGAYNIVWGNEPDRRTNFYVFDGEDYRVNTGSPAYNHRFFSALTENDLVGKTSLRYQLGESGNKLITAGYQVRSTIREFEATQFNFDFAGAQAVQVNNPDALFNQSSIDNGLFELETARGTNADALNPFTYRGNRIIHAGFINMVYDVLPSLTVNAGVRVESFYQSVIWNTNLGRGARATKEPYLLPSATVKYTINDENIVRLAYSKTYTFPQFKEVAPFFYEDVNISSFGNPNLKPAENSNVDLRYEHYFTNSDLFAFTVFYKEIKNPINRVQVASAANELSYVNTSAEPAQVAGAEVELRKEMFSKGNTTLDAGLNVSYLHTNQKLQDVPWDNLVFQPNSSESALEGASTWLANADITFRHLGVNNRSFMATLLFNYFTDRIYSIGAPMGNEHIIEVAIPRLDFIASYSFNRHFSAGLKMRNLLNPDHRLSKTVFPAPGETRDEIISSFTKGVSASVGISYKF